jgi:hypothetical protein
MMVLREAGVDVGKLFAKIDKCNPIISFAPQKK